jgi:hypothetical protein
LNTQKGTAKPVTASPFNSTQKNSAQITSSPDAVNNHREGKELFDEGRIDFFAKVKGIGIKEATKEFLRMAGVESKAKPVLSSAPAGAVPVIVRLNTGLSESSALIMVRFFLSWQPCLLM